MSAISGPAVSRPAVSSAVLIRRWRAVLILSGAAMLVLSAYLLLTTVKPARYIGIVEWFAAAIIVHDAIIAPLVFGVGLVMRKAGRRLPLAVLAIIQGGLVIGAVFTIVLVPEILAQQHAHLFQTLLPFDYLRNLGVLWVGTLVLTAVAVVGYSLWRAVRPRKRTG